MFSKKFCFFRIDAAVLLSGWPNALFGPVGVYRRARGAADLFAQASRRVTKGLPKS